MKVLLTGLIAAACLFAASANALAAERTSRPQRPRDVYPPRYQRASMAQWYKIQDRDGNVTYRKSYPGYGERFPAPAYLFYGYPHSGDYTGMGMGGSP